MLTVNFCPFFHFLIFNFFSKAQTHTNTHTYVCTYVYYSNDFNLRKIWVTQNLQEGNDSIIWGAPVFSLTKIS